LYIATFVVYNYNITSSGKVIKLNNRTVNDLKAVILDPRSGKAAADNFTGFNLFNYDLRSINDRISEDDTTDSPTSKVGKVNSYLVVRTDQTDLRAANLLDGSGVAITLVALQRNGSIAATINLSDTFDGKS